MKRAEPQIECCAFTENNDLMKERRNAVKKSRIRALLAEIQKNLKEIKVDGKE